MGRFERVITLDHLPPRRINETQLEHASRIVSALKTQGIEADQGYKEVAEHTGMTLREIYTLFHYVGVGDFAAQ